MGRLRLHLQEAILIGVVLFSFRTSQSDGEAIPQHQVSSRKYGFHPQHSLMGKDLGSPWADLAEARREEAGQSSQHIPPGISYVPDPELDNE